MRLPLGDKSLFNEVEIISKNTDVFILKSRRAHDLEIFEWS